MRNVVASTLQAGGAVSVVAGGFRISMGAGLLVLGVLCLVVGVLVDR